MRRAIVAVVLALAGCSDGSGFPSVEGHWRVEGDVVVCDGAAEMTAESTSVVCSWVNVSYAGQDRCSVTVSYDRPTVSDPWSAPIVFATHASCS